MAGGSLRLAGAATFALSEHFDGTDSPARVTIRYRLVEDDTVRDPVALDVEPPPGFAAVEGGGDFEGRLTRSGATFHFVSDPYRADWTGKLFAEAEPLGPETPSAGSPAASSGWTSTPRRPDLRLEPFAE